MKKFTSFIMSALVIAILLSSCKDGGNSAQISSNSPLSQTSSYSVTSETQATDNSVYSFSRLEKDLSIRKYLGDSIYTDYERIINALFDCESSVQLTAVSETKDYSRILRAVQAGFIFSDFLRDPLFLTSTPFDFDSDTKTLTIYYCWNDSTLSESERPCQNSEEYKKKIADFITLTEDIFNQNVTDFTDKAQTAKELYDYLSKNIEYKIDRTVTAYSAFYAKTAYCSIYSEMYSYLLHQAGVECYRCSGSTDGVLNDHEWNIIILDEKSYHVDVTYQASDPTIDGMYFAMSDRICEKLGHGSKSDFAMSDPLTAGEPFMECSDDKYDSIYRPWMS